MKVVSVVGARPQFIKAAAVSRTIRSSYGEQLVEVLVHTGQHFDHNMSAVFFEELGIPAPAHDLGISGGTHGVMTGRMLASIEAVLMGERPDWVLIYGDTNSTLAAALAAAKLHVPIAHVEAGLRSFNNRMPEEINRVLADRISTLLFCPSDAAVRHLANEGIHRGVSNVGDVMFDVSLYFREQAEQRSTIRTKLGLEPSAYVLATCHRAENTDDPKRLCEIMAGLQVIARTMKVVLPLHPRTRQVLATQGLLGTLDGMVIIEPLSFLDMIALEQSAAAIVTDSGGVQKEAFFFQVPCVTIRDETEWGETVDLGWNRLVGANRERIAQTFNELTPGQRDVFPYGNGTAADKIVRTILAH
ncbi:MAG: UDP-N-acetylglucosamine 2-epimerase (non-hydrolyzing) [Proteobacteria bacterium]|nr:UDP-N-acetylglucosamine 2-epimerase (non-hydrolyzing) [Pseudomonadota bacterium]